MEIISAKTTQQQDSRAKAKASTSLVCGCFRFLVLSARQGGNSVAAVSRLRDFESDAPTLNVSPFYGITFFGQT